MSLACFVSRIFQSLAWIIVCQRARLLSNKLHRVRWTFMIFNSWMRKQWTGYSIWQTNFTRSVDRLYQIMLINIFILGFVIYFLVLFSVSAKLELVTTKLKGSVGVRIRSVTENSYLCVNSAGILTVEVSFNKSPLLGQRRIRRARREKWPREIWERDRGLAPSLFALYFFDCS